MVGSMNAFEIYNSSKTDVVFALRYQGSSTNIVQHTYTPNDENRVTVSVKDIILPLLSFDVRDSSEPYVQPNIMKAFVATVYEVGNEGSKKEFSFSVIRAGVDRLADSAANFLKNQLPHLATAGEGCDLLFSGIPHLLCSCSWHGKV